MLKTRDAKMEALTLAVIRQTEAIGGVQKCLDIEHSNREEDSARNVRIENSLVDIKDKIDHRLNELEQKIVLLQQTVDASTKKTAKVINDNVGDLTETISAKKTVFIHNERLENIIEKWIKNIVKWRNG